MYLHEYNALLFIGRRPLLTPITYLVSFGLDSFGNNFIGQEHDFKTFSI